MAKRPVVIIGGGVAGLTAAHELKQRGFAVTVYERGVAFGGKARSLSVSGGAQNEIAGLPAEHGFRFFPGFYKHLPDTLGRIPSARGSVLESLVPIGQGVYARWGGAFFRFPTKRPASLREGLRGLRDLLSGPELGLSAGEAAFASLKLFQAMSLCAERREEVLENISWWDYMAADRMSDNYRAVVVNGLTQNFVAMDAQLSSTRSVINILARLLNDFVSGRPLDRVLNGPTSEVWIDPWLRHLENGSGGKVEFKADHTVLSLAFDETSGTVTGVTVSVGADATTRTITDPDAAYIAAVPVEAMIRLLGHSPGLREHAPSLKLLTSDHLKVNWMSGILFYLRADVAMAPGHVVYLDSNWALTSISQNQFWNKKVETYGSHKAKGVLSAIISDWFKPGNFNHEKATQADLASEIADEVLRELRAHVAGRPEIDLSDGNIVGAFLDPAIRFAQMPTEFRGLMPARHFAALVRDLHTKSILAVEENLEPLFINTKGSWVYRPQACTEVANLFLAADYVKTTTDLATMEGANEAGRRAVNGVLDFTRSHAQKCALFDFEEPLCFAPLQAIDRSAFKLGIPLPPPAPMF